MKKIITAVLLASFAVSAFAACPPYQPYRCIPGPHGKMICGCGV